jgi:hypothetical protein
MVLSPSRVLALSAFALFAMTSAAAADPAAPISVRWAAGTPAMQRAQAIATAHWGQSACGGSVTVRWAGLAPTINSVASWSSPLPATGDPTSSTDCDIVFNANGAFTWAKFCTVLAHEYGHLLGHGHSADGADLMSPVYHLPLPACTATRGAERRRI